MQTAACSIVFLATVILFPYPPLFRFFFFFFNDTATTEIYTNLNLFPYTTLFRSRRGLRQCRSRPVHEPTARPDGRGPRRDRKSTRLNSSHIQKSRMPSSA